MKINKHQIGLITDTIGDIFYRLQARLLGRFFKGPHIYFSVLTETDPMDSLEGVFRYTIATMYGPQASVDDNTIKHLCDITSNYIEAQRLKTVNHAISAAQQAETAKELEKGLVETVDKATSYIDMLTVTQTRSVQAYAEKDGITQVASSMNISDPTVAKLGVIDHKLCKNCLKLWHMPGHIQVPKVYKLSELADGYMTDWKNPYPTHGPTHPHCRHVLTFLPPNMGFDANGVIRFVKFGYDQYAEQRGTKKSELEYEPVHRHLGNFEDYIQYFVDHPCDCGCEDVAK